MVDLHQSSGSELDSDEELQDAFNRGDLKPGLNVEVQTKVHVNNVAGLKQKLDEFKQSLDWIERLDATNKPSPSPAGGEDAEGEEENLANNDFKRELRFYRQAQATVLLSVPRLHTLGIKTRRPEDYFAEMAKSDDHMKKVREKLLQKRTGMEHREKAKKLRDLRKYGKKVQVEVLQKRQKEKREMLEAVKKFRKGQKDKLDFLDDRDEMKTGPGKAKGGQKQDNRPHISNKKRQYKDKKFGFGGQKKRSKLNTRESANDMSTFNPRINQTKPKKGKQKAKGRPGKSRRQANKNKKRK